MIDKISVGCGVSLLFIVIFILLIILLSIMFSNPDYVNNTDNTDNNKNKKRNRKRNQILYENRNGLNEPYLTRITPRSIQQQQQQDLNDWVNADFCSQYMYAAPASPSCSIDYKYKCQKSY